MENFDINKLVEQIKELEIWFKENEPMLMQFIKDSEEKANQSKD